MLQVVQLLLALKKSHLNTLGVSTQPISTIIDPPEETSFEWRFTGQSKVTRF